MRYKYRAKVTDVYDGDTITVDIDLGFDLTLNGQKIRLYGINTPEVKGEEREQGLVVRDWLRSQILGQSILLETIKDKRGKFGRMLGLIHYNGSIINQVMIDKGYAVEYMV